MLLELFLSFFKIGLFSVGGGLASLPVVQNQIVDVKHWLTLTEFTDLITIAEMTPGPIAVNSAAFVGIRMAGILGAVIATIGCILPSCVIVSIFAYIYFKFKNQKITQGILSGVRPAVVAMIASAGLSILILSVWGESGFSLTSSVNYIAVILFAVCIFVLRKWKPSPILVMLGSGIIGGALYLVGS